MIEVGETEDVHGVELISGIVMKGTGTELYGNFFYRNTCYMQSKRLLLQKCSRGSTFLNFSVCLEKESTSKRLIHSQLCS